jgi:hypothetical protein
MAIGGSPRLGLAEFGSPEAELQPLEEHCGTSGRHLGDPRRTSRGPRGHPWRTPGGHLDVRWQIPRLG